MENLEYESDEAGLASLTAMISEGEWDAAELWNGERLIKESVGSLARRSRVRSPSAPPPRNTSRLTRDALACCTQVFALALAWGGYRSLVDKGMLRFRLSIVRGFLLLVAACTVTEPVVVIGKNGEILRGTTTASLSGGSFYVSDGKLTCGGSYNSMDTSPTISMPVTCSDGRRGIVIVTRDNSGTSGAGTVRLTDGSEATFMFGAAAAGF